MRGSGWWISVIILFVMLKVSVGEDEGVRVVDLCHHSLCYVVGLCRR